MVIECMRCEVETLHPILQTELYNEISQDFNDIDLGCDFHFMFHCEMLL